ncbi:MAG: ribonuclease P protein subunit [Candidatus Helarchaeota archaeon]
MKIKPNYIINQKLIGLNTKIISKHNPSITWNGKIIDETCNMFIILDDKTKIKKKIPKLGNIFMFNFENYQIEVNGKILIGRPENRIKKKRKY